MPNGYVYGEHIGAELHPLRQVKEGFLGEAASGSWVSAEGWVRRDQAWKQGGLRPRLLATFSWVDDAISVKQNEGGK